MNPVLQMKIDELEKADKYECWYLVKQPTSFDSICYLVSFLEEYQTSKTNVSLQGFVGEKVRELTAAKPNIEISDNYRALRVAAFFGLIAMTSIKYEDAIITDSFREITRRCAGEYEHTHLYTDIIKRQIEKMYISSQIDEEYQGVRRNYRLYPVMLLYKILLELGRGTGSYSLTMTEYRYLVATTKTFEGFLDTLLLIKLLREDKSNAEEQFQQYKAKFDNRLIQALKQLDTLVIDKNGVQLNMDRLDEVAKKVFVFEQTPDIFTADDYMEFIGSTKSLLDAGNVHGEKDRLTTGRNVLLYGVPGSGKSWTIKNEYCRPGSVTERLVFHPDYTYSDFVGQILPNVTDDGQVSYRFTPGPFTSILREAYVHPDTDYILIIEEINRGNAPAIFGEIFQLLDRKTEVLDEGDDGFPIGTSEYGITNTNIAEVVYGETRKNEKVRIPSNLSIIGTMNTSDQNVFTLDTAFQRRWDMRLVENDFADVDPKFADSEILDTTVTWKRFCTEINRIVTGNGTGMISSEDKRLGAYFVHPSDLRFNENMGDLKDYDLLRKKARKGQLTDDEKSHIDVVREAMRQNRKFPEKVIKYLWDDAFKFNREVLFDTANYQSLEEVIKAFMYANGSERFKVFESSVKDSLVISED